MTDAAVRWVSGVDDGTLASAYGVFFSVEPAGVPGRKMYYHRLEADNVLHTNGTKVRNVGREWLASDAAQYVEVHRSGTDVPRAAREFWDPPPHSGRESAEQTRVR